MDVRPAVDFDDLPAHFVRGPAWGPVAAACVDGGANVRALEGGPSRFGIGAFFGSHPRAGLDSSSSPTTCP
eukprot:9473826-Pyramimonas_sp.AAC.1